MKAHLYASPEPLTFSGPVVALCETEVLKPEIVAVWDDIPVGTRLDPEQLPKGMCTRCQKQESRETYLYAVREQQEDNEPQ